MVGLVRLSGLDTLELLWSNRLQPPLGVGHNRVLKASIYLWGHWNASEDLAEWARGLARQDQLSSVNSCLNGGLRVSTQWCSLEYRIHSE